MSSGKLAGGTFVTNAGNLTAYTVPASTVASFTLVLNNQGGNSISYSIYLATTGAPAANELFDTVTLPGGIDARYERTGICLDAGKLLVLKGTGTGITTSYYTVIGYEDPA